MKTRRMRRRGRRSLWGGLTVLVLVASLLATMAASATAQTAADKAALAKLVKQAKSEGELTVYTGTSEPSMTAIADAFQKKYGITVNHPPRQSGDTNMIKFETERNNDSSSADVILNTSSLTTNKLATEGLLEKMTPALVPALANYPKEFLGDYSFAFNTAPFGVCYNTNAVKGSDIKDWKSALLNRGSKLALSSTVPLPMVYQNMWNLLYKNYGINFLKSIGNSKPTLTPTSVAGLQLVESGQADVFFPCAPANEAQAKMDGAPVEIKFLYPTSGANFEGVIAKKSSNPAAARLFMNFLATKEGQEAFNANGVGSAPLLPKGDKALAIPPLPTAGPDKYVPTDINAAALAYPALQAALKLPG